MNIWAELKWQHQLDHYSKSIYSYLGSLFWFPLEEPHDVVRLATLSWLYQVVILLIYSLQLQTQRCTSWYPSQLTDGSTFLRLGALTGFLVEPGHLAMILNGGTQFNSNVLNSTLIWLILSKLCTRSPWSSSTSICKICLIARYATHILLNASQFASTLCKNINAWGWHLRDKIHYHWSNTMMTTWGNTAGDFQLLVQEYEIKIQITIMFIKTIQPVKN